MKLHLAPSITRSSKSKHVNICQYLAGFQRDGVNILGSWTSTTFSPVSPTSSSPMRCENAKSWSTSRAFGRPSGAAITQVVSPEAFHTLEIPTFSQHVAAEATVFQKEETLTSVWKPRHFQGAGTVADLSQCGP